MKENEVMVNFKSQKGQTLVEVLAGLGLILIVVTALIGMGVIALKTSSSARNRTIAVKLANEGMEMARAVRDQQGFDLLVSIPAQGVDVDGDGTDDFTRETVVSVDPLDSGKKLVVVTVSWAESSGTKSVSVTSYLTDWR